MKKSLLKRLAKLIILMETDEQKNASQNIHLFPSYKRFLFSIVTSYLAKSYFPYIYPT